MDLTQLEEILLPAYLVQPTALLATVLDALFAKLTLLLTQIRLFVLPATLLCALIVKLLMSARLVLETILFQPII